MNHENKPEHKTLTCTSDPAEFQVGTQQTDQVKATRAYKWLKWNGLSSGDCIMEAGATLVIYGDGSYSFRARVWSSDSNDEWCWEIDVLDGSGKILVRLPVYSDTTCFVMPDSQTWYTREANSPSHPKVAEAFGSIQSAIMHYDC